MSCRRDADIRPGLLARLRAAHPEAQVLEEVGLHHKEGRGFGHWRSA